MDYHSYTQTLMPSDFQLPGINYTTAKKPTESRILRAGALSVLHVVWHVCGGKIDWQLKDIFRSDL